MGATERLTLDSKRTAQCILVMEGPHWKNVRLFHDIDSKEILQLKKKKSMTILGSGSIVERFANLNLIDGYALVVVPVILDNGKPLFKDEKMTNLELLKTRSFKNGIALLRYKPVIRIGSG